jgi:putative aldouronate transport system permease protein
MLLPSILILLIYHYTPMLGLVIAFQKYKPYLGVSHSPWVGLDNFRMLFEYPDFARVFRNTVVIAGMKLVFHLVAPITFALLLNEVRHRLFKRTVQTFVYLPHFLSWVILGGILMDLLSPQGGLVNQGLSLLGIQPIFFLGDPAWFRAVVIISDVWKDFGFAAIIYLAALTGIDPGLYEAAVVDGASRWKQTLHITIPCLIPISIVTVTLSLRHVLDAGFDQIFILYNPLVYSTGDIIDTYVYRVGLHDGQYSIATAVGLFKSVINLLFVVLSYYLAKRFANYRIF